MVENFELGKNGKYGQIDFSKLKSGLKFEDIAGTNENLKPIFERLAGKDGVLDRQDIENLHKTLAGLTENENLSLKETKKFIDENGDKIGKQNAKLLLEFLQKLAKTTEGIDNVQTGEHGETITYENGVKETVFKDGSKEIQTKDNNIEKYDNKGILIYTKTLKDGNEITTEYKEGKVTKTTINSKDNIEVITSDGENTTKTITSKKDNSVATYVNNTLTKIVEGKTTHTFNGDVQTSVTKEGGTTTTVIKKNDGETLSQTQEIKSGKSTIKKVTTFNGNNSVSTTYLNGNATKQEKTIDGIKYSVKYNPDGNTPGIIVQNGESLSALAKAFGCSVQEIIDLNEGQVKYKGKIPYFLVGAEIVIPGRVEADNPALINRKTKEETIRDYEIAEAQRQAARRAAEAREQAPSPVQEAEQPQGPIKTPEEIKAEAKEIAQGFYDIADNNSGFKSMAKMKEYLQEKVNPQNIVDVLDAYQDKNIRKRDSSIIDTVISETGARSWWSQEALMNNSHDQKEVLIKILDNLCAAARNAGVSAEEIDKRRTQFTKSMEKELTAFGACDPTIMEKAVDALIKEIRTKEAENAQRPQNRTDENTAEKVASYLNSEIEATKQAFEEGRAQFGWDGKFADFVSRAWGSTNRESVIEADIKEYEAQINRLQLAQQGKLYDAKGNKVSFNDVFYEIFQKEFEQDKFDKYLEAESTFQYASAAKAQYEMFNEAFGSHLKKYKKNNLSASDEQFAKLLKTFEEIGIDPKEYYTNKGYDVDNLRHKDYVNLVYGLADEFLETSKQNVETFMPEGQTLETLKAEYDKAYTECFGDKNVNHENVTKWVKSQQTGTMVTRAGAVAGAALLTVGTFGASSPILAGALATAGTSAAYDLSAKATNKIDNAQDLSPDQIYQTVKNAAIDGGIYAATAGLMQLVPNANPKQALQVVKQILSTTAIDGTVAVAGDYAKTGTITAEGVAYNMLIALVANAATNSFGAVKQNLLGDPSVPQQKVPFYEGGDVPPNHIINLADDAIPDDNILKVATNDGATPTGGKLNPKKMELAMEQTADIGRNGTVADVVETNNQIELHGAQNRTQSRQLQHVLSDESQYVRIGKENIDIATADAATLAKLRKHVENFSDGIRNKQSLLDAIDARQLELETTLDLTPPDANAVSLEPKARSTQIVEGINQRTGQNADAILGGEQGILPPHDAATLESHLVNNLNTEEEINEFIEALHKRVGTDNQGRMHSYQTQGVDHAAALKNKALAKIKTIQAQKADFDDVIGTLTTANGRGLSADELAKVGAFVDKCTDANQLNQIKTQISKTKKSSMRSSLLKKCDAQIETLANRAVASTVDIDAPDARPIEVEQPKATPIEEPVVEVEQPKAAPIEEPVVEVEQPKATPVEEPVVEVEQPKTAPVEEPVANSVETPKAKFEVGEEFELNNTYRSQDSRGRDIVVKDYSEIGGSRRKTTAEYTDGTPYQTKETVLLADGSQKITTTDHTNGIVEHKTTNLDGSYTVETVANGNRTIEKFNKQGRKLSSITTGVEPQSVNTNKPDATPVEAQTNKPSIKERIKKFLGANESKINLASNNSSIASNVDVKLQSNTPVKVDASTKIRLGESVDIDLSDLDVKLNAMKDGDSFIIGRTASGANDIQINNPYVSGKHLKVEKINGEIFVTDLSSSNGTLLNTTKPDYVAQWKPNMNTKFAKARSGDFNALCDKYYDNLRLSDYSLAESVNKNISNNDIDIFIENNYVQTSEMNGWSLRTPKRVKNTYFESVDRISLNVKADKNLLKELDCLLETGEYITSQGKKVKIKVPDAQYKTPRFLEEWGTRHDPITMYFGDKVSKELEDALVDITQKYARTSSNGKSLMNSLEGKPWIAHEAYTPASKARALYQEAQNLNPQLADGISYWVGLRDGWNCSTGMYAAAERLVNEYRLSILQNL